MQKCLFVVNNGAITKINPESGAEEIFASNWSNIQCMTYHNGHLYIIANGFLSKLNSSNGQQSNFSGDWSAASHIAASGDALYIFYNGYLNMVNPNDGTVIKTFPGNWSNVEALVTAETQNIPVSATTTTTASNSSTGTSIERKVAALWGSEYYMAKIVSENGNNYSIVYDDGTVSEISIDRTAPGIDSSQAVAGLRVWAAKNFGRSANAAVIKSPGTESAVVTWEDGSEADVHYSQMAMRN